VLKGVTLIDAPFAARADDAASRLVDDDYAASSRRQMLAFLVKSMPPASACPFSKV
jgi:hypothetical protein